MGVVFRGGCGMKAKQWFILILSLGSSIQATVYLWELNQGNQRSCCLYLDGNDICNPNQPCTRNAAYDLTQILQYVTRIFLIDKGSHFAYHKVLKQAQGFINHALSFHLHMYYRYDVQRYVKFYHDIAESTKASLADKSNKNSTSLPSLDKQKNEDAVLAFLVKQGLAWPTK